MIDLFYKFLRIKKVILGRDYYFALDTRCVKETLGNTFADWTFRPDVINKQSVVYSFGVGNDISFDLQLIQKYGCRVFAFDPTPSTEQWVKKQIVPSQFVYSPIGLAEKEGTIFFGYIGNNPNVSASILEGTRELGFHAPVKPLSYFMSENGHNVIDILKMDIEGAEYDVVNQICQIKIPVKQLLVEFHHRFNWAGISKTKQAVATLRAAGYQIFNISRNGEEYSFIHKDYLNLN